MYILTGSHSPLVLVVATSRLLMRGSLTRLDSRARDVEVGSGEQRHVICWSLHSHENAYKVLVRLPVMIVQGRYYCMVQRPPFAAF